MDDDTYAGFEGIIGEYTVILSPHIGIGTFGSVHKATHNRLGHSAAAKQMLLMDGNKVNDYLLGMAERELSFLRSLQAHDNIVKLYGHINRRNTYWLFMEYCDLGNLHGYLRDNFDLPLFKRITIMHELASALTFMHSQDPPIIHRDIKLENLLMKKEGKKHILKITDFGLSKLLDNPKSLSMGFNQANYMTTTCGARFFMAPEFFSELEGGVKYDSSIDIFATGLVFLIVMDAKQDNDLVPLSGNMTYWTLLMYYSSFSLNSDQNHEWRCLPMKTK